MADKEDIMTKFSNWLEQRKEGRDKHKSEAKAAVPVTVKPEVKPEVKAEAKPQPQPQKVKKKKQKARRIYVYDAENIKPDQNGLDSIDMDDEVVLFLNQGQTLPATTAEAWSRHPHRMFVVQNGYKNALDIQLSTWVGSLLHTEDANKLIVIVSHDRIYDYVANFWQSRGLQIMRVESVPFKGGALPNNAVTVPPKPPVPAPLKAVPVAPARPKPQPQACKRYLESKVTLDKLCHQLKEYGMTDENAERLSKHLWSHKTRQALTNTVFNSQKILPPMARHYLLNL